VHVFTVFTRIFLLKTIWSVKVLLSGSRLCTKLFFRALRYWRVLEFPYTLAKLPRRDKLEILDISSPKILSFYLAKKYGHRVTAIDIWDKEIAFWKDILKLIGTPQTIAGNMDLAIGDATCLSYGDESFDFVYSICVIEHIDGDGDSRALQEISRVLKQGGIAVITVPFDKNGREVFRSEDVYHKTHTSSPVFYERWYNRHQLQERLVAGSGLELVDFQLAFEKYLAIHHTYLPTLYKSVFPVRILWNAIEPLVGLLNLRTTPTVEAKKEGIALLTLRKP
jgi:SAM-dependent methyltransferase